MVEHLLQSTGGAATYEETGDFARQG
eukprot:COSAG01_NODE_50315_length_364_cov_0.815094_1_plen_25_part_01